MVYKSISEYIAWSSVNVIILQGSREEDRIKVLHYYVSHLLNVEEGDLKNYPPKLLERPLVNFGNIQPPEKK